MSSSVEKTQHAPIRSIRDQLGRQPRGSVRDPGPQDHDATCLATPDHEHPRALAFQHTVLDRLSPRKKKKAERLEEAYIESESAGKRNENAEWGGGRPPAARCSEIDAANCAAKRGGRPAPASRVRRQPRTHRTATAIARQHPPPLTSPTAPETPTRPRMKKTARHAAASATGRTIRKGG